MLFKRKYCLKDILLFFKIKIIKQFVKISPTFNVPKNVDLREYMLNDNVHSRGSGKKCRL